MNAQDVMMREVHTVAPRALLVEAARIMAEHDIGFLPVVDDKVVVGVVTDRDMVERGVAGACNPTQVTVVDIMSVEIVCCFPDTPTGEVKQLMSEHGLSRMPVIDEHNQLLGVVCLSDIDGGPPVKKKSVHVKFQKEKTDSYGRPHKVPIKTVYITGKTSTEEAVEAAVKRFEAEQKTSWTAAADSIDVEEEPDPKGGKSSR